MELIAAPAIQKNIYLWVNFSLEYLVDNTVAQFCHHLQDLWLPRIQLYRPYLDIIINIML